MLLHLEATGLLGGHSGTDINKEHQNANLLMARMINHLFHNTDALLVDFNGGTKDNAILVRHPQLCSILMKLLQKCGKSGFGTLC